MFRSINRPLFTLIFSVFLIPTNADAAKLTSVQDFISDSRPSATSTEHTFMFYVTTAVPVSGKIVITPSSGDFTVESGLSFTDIDLLVNNVQKTIASVPGTGIGSQIGVSVTSGTSGSITLILNDTDPIVAGSFVEIRIGSVATLGGVGTKTIQLPSALGAYSIHIKTQDSSSVDIDTADTMIVVIAGVGVSSGEISTSGSSIPAPTSVSVSQGGGGAVPRIYPVVVVPTTTPLLERDEPRGKSLTTGRTSTPTITGIRKPKTETASPEIKFTPPPSSVTERDIPSSIFVEYLIIIIFIITFMLIARLIWKLIK